MKIPFMSALTSPGQPSFLNRAGRQKKERKGKEKEKRRQRNCSWGGEPKKKRAVAADKSVRDRRVTSGLLPAVPQSRLRVRDQLTVTSCTKTAGRAEGGGLNT